MYDRAVIIVEEDPSRDEHEQRSRKLKRDLNRARKNIDELQRKIINTEKEIDEVSRAKETLEENNKKFESVIRQKGGGSSRKAVQSGTRQLRSSENTSADRGLKLNRLKDKRHELEVTKRKWETLRENIEEECHRRAVFEDRMRNQELRSCESWEESSYHPARTTAESSATATATLLPDADGPTRAKAFGTDQTKEYPVKKESVAVMRDESH
ncbi:hypothetical protein LB503_012712 [Fusarium chuoi]|nr:hypothetical protein LB503_012712 [Fusarium chuoi]